MPSVTELDIWVRSTDLDADAIVNNARYFEFFEQVRIEHMIRLGMVVRPRPVGDHDRSITIAETTCRFKAPLRHRDVATVKCWTKEVRNRSFTLEFQMVLKGTGKLVAEGSSAQVWLDASGVPSPIPPDKKQRLMESIG